MQKVVIYVTGICKKGLPHTSISMNLKDCNLGFKVLTNLKFSHSINTYYSPNFMEMAVFNLKL